MSELLTPWFDQSQQAPWEPGLYQRCLDPMDSFGLEIWSVWNGECWGFASSNKLEAIDEQLKPSAWQGNTHRIYWRGLSSDPSGKGE